MTDTQSTNEFPNLTLTPTQTVQDTVTQVSKDVENAIDESKLTDNERKLVSDFASKIDLNDSMVVLQYGSAAQQKIADFSDSALQNVRTKDLGEVGGMVLELVNQLKCFDVEEETKGFFGLFKRASNKIDNLKVKYDKAEVSVERICGVLEGHQIQLLKDVSMLDKLYDMNLTNFKELSLYIIAGKKRLVEAQNTTLIELKNKAKASGLPEDAQAASDFAALCDRFEKKLHDLELTRMISIQSAPQIRLIQNNDTLMAEKIQSTLVNTIPLWKSQMLIALGLANSQDALNAQREVTDMTNALLRKNADALKLGAVETAKEAERGVVDIETLTYTNTSLIQTLDEVMQINEDGRAKRRAAELELGRIEGELKNKLLEIRK